MNPENLNIDNIIPILHQIVKLIDEEVENGDENKVSDIIQLMQGIVNDNWMFIRNK